MRKLILILSALFMLTGCEKEINLNLDDQSGIIVIDGNVTDQPGPYFVKLSRSVSFTQPNEYPAISGATVVITDNTGQREQLIDMGNGKYSTTQLTTVAGNSYTLTVTADGKTYTATSKLAQPVTLDSLKQDSIKFGSEVRYTIRPMYTDPITIGNSYRFIISVNGKASKEYNLISDNIDNGKVNQRAFSIIDNDDDDEPKKGDVIEVEMHGIDPGIYAYYSTLDQISGRGPGGGITPANPPSNFSGGALGRFSAHTISKKSIIFQ